MCEEQEDFMIRKIRKKKNKLWIYSRILYLTVIVGVCIWIYLSQYQLVVEKYTVISPKIQETIRVVQLSDLHNRSFGKDNEKLIKMVEELTPDIICMTGDMLNRNEESLDVVENLVKQLSDMAPVYFSYGNHEEDYEDYYQTSIRDKIEKAGATVLDNESIETVIGNTMINIGGASQYGMIEPRGNGDEYQFLKQYEESDDFKLLLCHIPAGMLLWRGLELWNVDLVLSGHEHGGQIIVPGIGGLYSQDEGFFPEYTEGIFTENGHTLILSRGLGSGNIVPRINNTSEIVCINLEPSA